MKKAFYIMAALFASFALRSYAEIVTNQEVKEDSDNSLKSFYEDYKQVAIVDTVYQRGTVMVCTDLKGGCYEVQGFNCAPMRFVTFKEGKPAGMFFLEGGLRWKATDEALLVDVGVDTLRLSWEHLPKSIAEVPVKGYKYYRHLYPFKMSPKSAWSTNSFIALLPEEHPEWLDYFIIHFGGVVEGDSIEVWESSVRFGRYEQYAKCAEARRPSTLLDSLLQELAQQASTFRTDSDDESAVGDSSMYGATGLLVYPVWKSSDGRLATFRFCELIRYGEDWVNFYEYYFTFDWQTGHVLGHQDLFTDRNYERCLKLVAGQMPEFTDPPGEDPIFTEEERRSWKGADITNDPSRMTPPHWELYKERCIPFPALTKEGVLFNYQGLEKTIYYGNIISIVVPYDKVKLKLKP